MAVLLDTTVLVRLGNASDAWFPVATQAILNLHRRGEMLHLSPQVLIEYRNVATRPMAVNGLGLTPAQAATDAAAFEAKFPLLPDTPEIYPAWKAVVSALGIIGKQVHDARLVAVCHAHRISHLLTFNIGHFSRMATFGSGLVVVDPVTV